jgi:hypothetical protein
MSREKIQRNKRVVKLYKTKKYTLRSLGNIFKISHPRVIAILKRYKRGAGGEGAGNKRLLKPSPEKIKRQCGAKLSKSIK